MPVLGRSPIPSVQPGLVADPVAATVKAPGRAGRERATPDPPAPSGPSCAGCWAICGPHALILTGVILAALATTAVELAPPWIIRLAVDRFILRGGPEQVWWAAGGLLALSLRAGWHRLSAALSDGLHGPAHRL